MAETEAAASGAKGAANVFTKKIGPLPMVVWLGAGVAFYYYFSHKQKSSASATGTPANQQTDPAGNVGSIDPATGYVYGTPEDNAALSSQNSSGGSSSSSTSGSTTAGSYADNNAWAQAAINYLVARGVDAVEANSAITQYISSQTLTTQQQADVNLAIQGIGSPPTPPTPGNAPPPVVTPPTGTVYASNPPTGVSASNISATSVTLNWNKVTNATAYTVTWSGGSTTVNGTNTTATISGLKPATNYTFTVQATPAKPGDPAGSVSATTSKGATLGGGNPPGSGKPPVGTVQKTTTVTVVKWTPTNTPWNSTLSGIAAHYGTTVAAIQKLNPSITNVNLIHPGQQIIVPVK